MTLRPQPPHRRRNCRAPTNPVLWGCGIGWGQPTPCRGWAARGRRSDRTQGLSPLLSVIPPRNLSEPERLDGSRPQTRWGQGMDQVVGIDISKARLDVFCLASRRRLAVGNDAAGIDELAGWLEPGSLVVMEASGGYERLVHRLVDRARGQGCRGQCPAGAPVRQGAGLLAKTDRLDAAVIARYGAFAKPAPTPVRAGAREALAETLAYRRQLLAEITARAQQLAHLRTPSLIERAKADLAAAAPRQGGARPAAARHHRWRSAAAGQGRPARGHARRRAGLGRHPAGRAARARASSTGARSPASSASPRSPRTAA